MGLRSPGRRGTGSSPGRGREEQEQEKGEEQEQIEEQEQEEGGDWETGSDLWQLDGNASIHSEEDSGCEYVDIPIQLRHRPARPPQEQRTPVLRTVRRSNKLVDALSAPSITLYNVCSEWAKWDSIAEDINMRALTYVF